MEGFRKAAILDTLETLIKNKNDYLNQNQTEILQSLCDLKWHNTFYTPNTN